MNRKEFLLLGSSILFLLYTIFWVKVFTASKKPPQTVLAMQTHSAGSGLAQIITPTPFPTFNPQEITITPTPTIEVLPDSVNIPIPSRTQAFGLSCEFAAADAILYFYSQNAIFAPNNEKSAEELLISQMNISNNPNIGIRMGQTTPQDTQTLYTNLNKRFGGTDNYGIHAPPFIDFFNHYGLLATPFNKPNLTEQIKNAIYSNHLIMVWIQVEKGSMVNVPLSYGQVSVVPGEHVVVINGYNQDGVQVMDPGLGIERTISYPDLFLQTQAFSMPFLEIAKSQISYFSLATILPFAQSLGLDRKNLRIKIINASGIAGKGDEIAQTLLDFGYNVVGLVTQTDLSKENISIILRPDKSDYSDLLKKDIGLSLYTISSFQISSSVLQPNTDAQITIGN